MHEIRATMPPELAEEAARLAHEAGIERVSIAEVFIHGPGLTRRIVSADTSTPKARAFVDALLNSPAFSGVDYSVTSREGAFHREQRVRGHLDQADERTFHRRYPGSLADEPRHDQLCVRTRGCRWVFCSRPELIHDNPIAIVVAALFLPYLSQVLAISFGLWSRGPGPASERHTGGGSEHRSGPVAAGAVVASDRRSGTIAVRRF